MRASTILASGAGRPSSSSVSLRGRHSWALAMQLSARHGSVRRELAVRAGIPAQEDAQPTQPFACALGLGPIQPLRVTDRRAQSDTPFRLFGMGSVGSQVLTGIPRLEALRFDSLLGPQSVVWPFETGWAPTCGPLDRSRASCRARRDRSERASAAQRDIDQGPRSGSRHVALGARPRRAESPRERIRNPAWDRRRVAGRRDGTHRGTLDPRVPVSSSSHDSRRTTRMFGTR